MIFDDYGLPGIYFSPESSLTSIAGNFQGIPGTLEVVRPDSAIPLPVLENGSQAALLEGLREAGIDPASARVRDAGLVYQWRRPDGTVMHVANFNVSPYGVIVPAAALRAWARGETAAQPAVTTATQQQAVSASAPSLPAWLPAAAIGAAALLAILALT